MVVHHWSDDGMVMYHRRSLERILEKSSSEKWQDMINPNASKWMKNTKNGKHWAMTGYEVFVCAASVFSGCFLLFSLPFLLFFSFTLVAASSPIPSLFPSFSFSGCSLLFSLPFPLFFPLVAAPSFFSPPFPLFFTLVAAPSSPLFSF